MAPIELRAVAVSYDGAVALDGVTVTVAPGEWVCIIGPNGAGKTTVLRAIAGGVHAGGAVSIDGTPVASLGHRRRAQLVASVPQLPVLPDGLPVLDYVLMGRTPHLSLFAMETERDVQIALGVLERLDLAGFAERSLASLSGGEVQRAVIARALAQQAPILLLDEPTTGLDVGHQQAVLELVDRLRSEDGLTVVMTMHDLTLAGQYADRLILLDEGRIVAEGTADEVLREDLIARHYNARVRIERTPHGAVMVIPVREDAREAVS